MKKIEFDVLELMMEQQSYDKEYFAILLVKTVEEIERCYKALEAEEYVLGTKITEKGLSFLREHKIDNAIILAAGMSTRFVPINFEKPKGLLEVNGEVLIERQICQLKEKGISEIIVVVGYMKEQFEYLKDKFGVILVEAKDYERKNI